jgi:hypothetical protein
MEQWRQATRLALLSFKAGQGTLQRKKDVATVAKKKEQHTRCAQLRIRRKLARTREPHRLQEREEAKHDGHATQAATKAATMAGAEAKKIVPTVVCVSAVATLPSPPSPQRAGAEVVQPESNNEEKKKEVKEEEGKAELTMMPGQQKATSSMVGVPLSLHEAEIAQTESEKDDEKKKKKRKKKKTPSKTAERREHGISWDLTKLTGRELLDNFDRCVAEGLAVPPGIDERKWRRELSQLPDYLLHSVIQPKRRSGRLHPNQTAV